MGIRLVPRTCFSPQSRRGGLFDLVLAKRILRAEDKSHRVFSSCGRKMKTLHQLYSGGNNVQTAINRVCLQVFRVTKFKDLFLQRNSGRRRNENIILPRPETHFIWNSIRFRGAIEWNTLTNKETGAKTLKDFKRCLVKFDTDKMNFNSNQS